LRHALGDDYTGPRELLSFPIGGESALDHGHDEVSDLGDERCIAGLPGGGRRQGGRSHRPRDSRGGIRFRHPATAGRGSAGPAVTITIPDFLWSLTRKRGTVQIVPALARRRIDRGPAGDLFRAFGNGPEVTIRNSAVENGFLGLFLDTEPDHRVRH